MNYPLPPLPQNNIHSYPAAIQHRRRLSLGVPTQGNQTLARSQMCWLVEYPISPSPWWQLQCGWRSRDLGFSHHIFKPSACVWRHRCNYLSSASTPLRKKTVLFMSRISMVLFLQLHHPKILHEKLEKNLVVPTKHWKESKWDTCTPPFQLQPILLWSNSVFQRLVRKLLNQH